MFSQKFLLVAACILAVSNCLAVSEEEYLKNVDEYVDSEASKMDAPESLDPGSAPAPATQLKSKSEGQLNQAEFESFLQGRHAGTFSFYKSLATEDRARVYREFSSGMPMRKIRRLVIELKMQHRQ